MRLRTLIVVNTLSLLLCCSTVGPAKAEAPRTLIQQGERFLAMGRYPAAMARYTKVLECCPGTIEASEAHNDIGVIHARQGNMDLAIKAYEAALQGVPFPLAHFNLGKALADRFKENGDHDTRLRAKEHLLAFQAYLSESRQMPPVITMQQDEIESYLSAIMADLSDDDQ